ncbi:hypothetical protein LX36DRAFT_662828 [Colletotrichum falcatum]|nr:hypothetical protein LX36DRAFT_662828 [Colletotrichum falcatum]
MDDACRTQLISFISSPIHLILLAHVTILSIPRPSSHLSCPFASSVLDTAFRQVCALVLRASTMRVCVCVCVCVYEEQKISKPTTAWLWYSVPP